MKRVLLKFANGAVMDGPDYQTGEPVADVFRLTTPEGAIFMFDLIDELPSGKLVYKEWQSDAPIESRK